MPNITASLTSLLLTLQILHLMVGLLHLAPLGLVGLNHTLLLDLVVEVMLIISDCSIIMVELLRTQLDKA